MKMSKIKKRFRNLALDLLPALALDLTLALLFPALALADGPADNLPDRVRPIPPRGIAVSPAETQSLRAELQELQQEINSLWTSLQSRPTHLDLLPDVQIYEKAVRYALELNEFFDKRDIPIAHRLLQEGRQRADLLKQGKAPWTKETGLVVRGYISKIDDSVQPFGIVVPASYAPETGRRHRLDVWLHGRGETLSELSFIAGRERSPGEFTPPDAFVLHPYGRYCNANRFAGEVDVYEALAHVMKEYPIDPNRLVMRGFSMGGAACWQFAVHDAGRWAAAAPGAGFSETADFLKVFQQESLKPAWYETRLWHLYDSTDYAINLFNCPTVAYSGEIDRQKQAADKMVEALAREGINLVHIIGPKTAHAYHQSSKIEINRRIDSVADHGRNPLPDRVKFTTWTLRYNSMLWVTVDGLEEHWRQACVNARIVDDHTVTADTANVTAFSFSMAPGLCPLDETRPPKVMLDGHEVAAPPVLSDRSWEAHFHKDKVGRWLSGRPPVGILAKRHGLQGPIDDAFMDRFLMVRPTGPAFHEMTGNWFAAEMNHAIAHWRLQFRGAARVRDDVAVTDKDIAESNLILWGDPSSNKLLARIADRLPVEWTGELVRFRGSNTSFPPGRSVPVLIYPNPLNPNRYVVLNSGFTFREYDYLNNARQTPKLPDYAIVQVDIQPTSRLPGYIAAAGFFDEGWRVRTTEAFTPPKLLERR
jgi:dienelactone hydrolase